MKITKSISLLILSIFCITYHTQAQSIKGIDYNNPSLDFFTTDPADTILLFNMNSIDLSALKYTFNEEEGTFETMLPFIVDRPVGSSQIFWFFKYIPEERKDFSWMIYESNNTDVGICRSFRYMKSAEGGYNVLQGQDQLTVAIQPGRYLLKIVVNDIPDTENIVYLRTGITSKLFYYGLRSGFYLGRL